ncbi:YtxH domain-containing protein [Candidatus Gracilibacteria bacterium]|nr:YtxH domain-containing protein [Candidatus Gracilibacteria bacterium]
MEKSNHSGNFWLAGVLGGILLGMLFAPKKGSELRGQIAKAGSGGTAKQLEVIKEEFVEMLHDMHDTVQSLKDSKQAQKLLKNITEYTKGEDAVE